MQVSDIELLYLLEINYIFGLTLNIWRRLQHDCVKQGVLRPLGTCRQRVAGRDGLKTVQR